VTKEGASAEAASLDEGEGATAGAGSDTARGTTAKVMAAVKIAVKTIAGPAGTLVIVLSFLSDPAPEALAAAVRRLAAR
jgi:hypothetical protein